jgi:hypothetical protein
MAETFAVPRQRHLFIDLYRSAVILLMLEGHVVRTFLLPYLQQLSTFQLHEVFHGLSAPAFLFGAGLTFVISTRKRWQEYHHWGAPLSRRVRRLLFVIALGLMLHLPFFSFRKIILDGTTADYLELFQCDVLACIGIGLLSLHGLVFFFKKESYFYGLVFGTIVVVCFLTPIAWNIDVLQYVPPFIAQLINSIHGSPFPLIPYVGFLFAGVIISWEFLVAVEKGSEKLFMLQLAVIGALLVAGGMLFDALPVHLYPHYDFWYTSPNYFLIRVGVLMCIVSCFWYISSKISRPVLPLTVLGRESLFVYVLHLIVLYGTAMNNELNLRSMIGDNLTVVQTIGVFLGFALVMFLCALMWNYLKRRHHNVYRIVQLAGSGLFLYYFCTQDF